MEKRLRCTVVANTGKYRWLKDGRLIKKSPKYGIKKFKYLKIRNIRHSDQGVYLCQAYNVEGNVNKTVYLKVVPKGGFTLSYYCFDSFTNYIALLTTPPSVYFW